MNIGDLKSTHICSSRHPSRPGQWQYDRISL